MFCVPPIVHFQILQIMHVGTLCSGDSIFLPFFSSVSAKAVIRNKKRTGDMLSPWQTPIVWDGLYSLSLSLVTILRYVCSLLVTDTHLEGAPYFPRIWISNLWSAVLHALTRSTNRTNVWRLCCLRLWRTDLRMKDPSWHPFLGVAPNWLFVLCPSSRMYSLSVSILPKILEHASVALIPLHLLGLLMSPLFGFRTNYPSFHSQCYGFLFQKSQMNSKTIYRFLSSMHFNTFGGTPLSSRALSFFRTLIACVNSIHSMSLSKSW